ncbi:MAG: hypothetical protein K2K97_08270 [Muribaculaceae bacterium]|nr:hypothetical protein [Muribaculaceae bacterium]
MKNLILTFVCLLLFMSCTRKIYLPVETVRMEYKDNIREIHTTDSVTDTRFVYVKGDTVKDYRDKVQWRNRIIHDSIYISKTDTICVPYAIEKTMTKWQKTKMDLGGIAIGVLLTILGIVILYFVKNKITRRVLQ